MACKPNAALRGGPAGPPGQRPLPEFLTILAGTTIGAKPCTMACGQIPATPDPLPSDVVASLKTDSTAGEVAGHPKENLLGIVDFDQGDLLPFDAG